MSVTITMHEDASVSIESKAAAGYSLKVNKNKAAIQQGVLLIIEAGLEVMREQLAQDIIAKFPGCRFELPKKPKAKKPNLRIVQ